MLSLRTTACLSSSIRLSRLLRASPNPAFRSALLVRGYAHSRFEKPRPGAGRERPRFTPRQNTQHGSAQTEEPSSSTSYEERPSVEESVLWEQGVRPPASNPEDGLRRLLMENDRLIVTRCALFKYGWK